MRRFVFMRAPPTANISALSLHDALPISRDAHARAPMRSLDETTVADVDADVAEPVEEDEIGHVGIYIGDGRLDRKSTRLNSSHVSISYAVFCLKKKSVRDNALSGLTAGR